MERYTIAVTNAQDFQFFTSRFHYDRLVDAIIEAMAASENGSARVTLIEGSKSTGDIVARWYPKTRRPGLRRINSECVVDKVRDALSELNAALYEGR